MNDIKVIKTEVAQMSQNALKMLELTHRAFMEHDLDLIAEALGEETKINELEKSITIDLVSLSRSYIKKEERTEIAILVDVVEDLELVGDYSKDILERVQIKIEEKLLFSDEAVKEYNQLYVLTVDALKEIVNAFLKEDLSLVKEVLKNEQHIDKLVDQLRKSHNQRLLNGVCIPMACNMFLNMLDFTAAIYYHAKKISRSLLKIKHE